nr:hypothetical protein [Tanacetum cinerariifolium]
MEECINFLNVQRNITTLLDEYAGVQKKMAKQGYQILLSLLRTCIHDCQHHRQISAIRPWENIKSATIEADLKQIEVDIEIKKAKERDIMKNKMDEEKTGTFAMLFHGTFVDPFKKHSYSSCCFVLGTLE